MEYVIQDKFVRQLNLLGLALGHPGEYDTIGFALLFQCDEVTVKRDLKELRSQGIDIHARRRKGISVGGTIPDQLLRAMLRQYLGLTASKNMFDPSVHRAVAKLGQNALALFAEIQFARDNFRQLRVTLKDDPKGKERIIEPRMLYHGRNEWFLAAQTGYNSFIRISLDNIASLQITRQPFMPSGGGSASLIRKISMRGFEADEIIEIRTYRKTEDELFGLDLMHFFPAEQLNDHLYRVYVSEPDLKVLLLWIMSRSDEIASVKPRHISEKISELAQSVAKKYKAAIEANRGFR